MPSDPQTTTIVPLFGGADPRYGELLAAIIETVRERGKGLLFVGVVGALRLAEARIIQDQQTDGVGIVE